MKWVVKTSIRKQFLNEREAHNKVKNIQRRNVMDKKKIIDNNTQTDYKASSSSVINIAKDFQKTILKEAEKTIENQKSKTNKDDEHTIQNFDEDLLQIADDDQIRYLY